MTLIQLQGVTKRYGAVDVLGDINLTVSVGETLGLVGAGGSGKSLILKVICGLLVPDTGRVLVDGVSVTEAKAPELMSLRARIGMIFQNYALFDDLDVGDNIAFPLRRLGGCDPSEISARVEQRLAQVHLPGIERKMTAELSGGMKKRVCLARATVHNPTIMLCDDPTAGLDPVTTNRIFALLKTLQAQNGATAIIVSHEVGYLMPLCDRLVMLDAGRIIFDGSPAEAASHPDATVREFVAVEGAP